MFCHHSDVGLMNSETSERKVETIQVPIAGLKSFFSTLLESANLFSIPSEQWRGWCLNSTEAECELCGIKVNGAELAELTQAESLEKIEKPKIRRLFHQYCARNSCENRYYTVRLVLDEKIEWARLKEVLENGTVLIPAERKTEGGAAVRVNSRVLIGVLMGGCAAILVLFFFYHSIYGGRIPLIQKRHIYVAETNQFPQMR
jgi:hypothetical protein